MFSSKVFNNNHSLKKQLSRLLIAPIFLFTSCLVDAQNWYQVELIVFSQNDSFGDEKSLPDIKLHYPGNLARLNRAESGGQFTLIDKSARRLNPDAYTLNSTGVYKVLFHEAWHQPGLSRRSAPWLLINGGKQRGSHRELEGSIRLYLTNYLHFETNLWLLRTTDNSPAGGEQTLLSNYPTTDELPFAPHINTGSPPLSASETTQVTPAHSDGMVFNSAARSAGSSAIKIRRIYTHRQSERIQLSKTYYLDHPNMGLLLKVVRAGKTEPSPELNPQSASPTTQGNQAP